MIKLRKYKLDNKKRVIIIVALAVAILIVLSLAGNKPTFSGGSTTNIEISPLSSKEVNKVGGLLLSSEFIQDVPENSPIALRFFKMENGQKIWQDGFLIGRDKLLTEGEPSLYLSMNSKYIEELGENNLCEIIQRAYANGDIGYESEHNMAMLLIKYAGMVKHRECFGL